MGVVASAHVADVGPVAALRALARIPRPGSVPGLRHAEVAAAASLSPSPLPKPTPGRVALVAFWDDDCALDAFLHDHPLAAALSGGWHARLEPLRAFGTWPGLPELPADRATPYSGPAVVLTLGRLRMTQAVRFVRASAKAEGSAVDAPGMAWGTALARPPLVATLSLWDSVRALSEYAYGRQDPSHVEALAADRARPFHRASAFVRFRPYEISGQLGGRNPLPHAVFGDPPARPGAGTAGAAAPAERESSG